MWVLIGIAIIIAGFLLRFNPLLVIMASALATGLAAGLDIGAIISAFGKAFNDTRYVSIIWIVLPVIGLLEAYGLQQHARTLIARMRGATRGRTVWQWPATEVRPTADMPWRRRRYPVSNRPSVAPRMRAISVRACCCRP